MFWGLKTQCVLLDEELSIRTPMFVCVSRICFPESKFVTDFYYNFHERSGFMRGKIQSASQVSVRECMSWFPAHGSLNTERCSNTWFPGIQPD